MLLVSSQHSEAAQVFQNWQNDITASIGDDDDEYCVIDTFGTLMGDMMMIDSNEMDPQTEGADVTTTISTNFGDNGSSHPGVVSDDDDYSSDDTINTDDDMILMQLDDDEGLLPNTLEDDIYDSLARDVLTSSSSPGCPINDIGNGSCSDMDMLLMLQEVEESPSALNGSNSFFTNHHHPQSQQRQHQSLNDERARFDATVRKLAESMRKSQATRRSLYTRSTGLENYKRTASVQQVLQSIEFSTRHVDSYCRKVGKVSMISSTSSPVQQ
jgi:hypothetical protein